MLPFANDRGRVHWGLVNSRGSRHSISRSRRHGRTVLLGPPRRLAPCVGRPPFSRPSPSHASLTDGNQDSGAPLKRRALLRWVGIAFLAIPARDASPSEAAAPGVCIPMVVANDTSKATAAGGPISGEAIGQVFFAPETLITEIDVWRPAGNQSVIGARILVTGVDTTRVPPFPEVGMKFQDGPTVTVYDSDPPGQLIRMPFVFDPPVVLPRPGTYAMFFQAENCYDAEPWRLLFSWNNDYPYGILWVTGHSQLSCRLPPPAGGGDNDDLIFEIHFCDDRSTPTRHESWGRLKVLYR